MDMQTSPLQRIGQVAGVVTGQENQGFGVRLNGTEFRYGNLKILQHFQKQRFKLKVSFIDFIDEQYTAVICFHRL